MSENDFSIPTVGRRMVILRTALECPASQFAEKIGISPQKLNNYEKGRNAPPSSLVATLRQKTGVSSDWLWFGDERFLPVHLYEKIKRAEEQLEVSPQQRAAL